MLTQKPLCNVSVVCRDSTESLDIKAILSDHPYESILAASLSLLSTISIAHSFTDIPSFPSHEASTPLFLNIISASATAPNETHTVTIPTSPRLKAMLMEPVVVDCWAKGLPSKPSISEAPEYPEDFPVPPAWIPEGRILPPDTFLKLFRRGGDANEPIVENSSEVNIQESSLCVEASYGRQQLEGNSDDHSTSPYGDDDPGTALSVPTIMLSNSTAAMALSFESSQSLAPLAVRRGHKVPAPLTLTLSKSTDDGLYPGIPSPFLGSPTTLSPKFEFSSNSVDPPLDLSAMCQDLRSRCPPLRPDSPLPLTQPASPADTSMSSAYTDPDSDDWAFAKDFLDKHGNSSPQLEAVLSGTPMKIIPEIQDEPLGTTTPETDSYSWSSDPTLTNSPESPEPITSDVTGVDIPKQQRRRTVIIETPRNSMIENTRPTRVTIDLSHLAEDNTPLSPEFDRPIPFETPRPRSNTAPAYSESSRPMSSASMKAPSRGILKSTQKKSVRFSVMPSMHEYAEDESDSSVVMDQEPAKKSGLAKSLGRKRASSEPNSDIHQGSHVKQSTPSPAPVANKPNRVSFPKHPAVRSFVRGSTASPSPASRNSNVRQSLPGILVPRNVEKAEVSPPKKLLKRSTVDTPASAKANEGKSLSNKENSGKRGSMVATKVSQAGESPKSRIKSIFTRLRA